MKVQIADPQNAKGAMDPAYLRDLCRKEVDEFERYMRANEPTWSGGLASWEKQVLKTYLYQKIRGRIEPPSDRTNAIPTEGSHGSP